LISRLAWNRIVSIDSIILLEDIISQRGETRAETRRLPWNLETGPIPLSCSETLSAEDKRQEPSPPADLLGIKLSALLPLSCSKRSSAEDKSQEPRQEGSLGTETGPIPWSSSKRLPGEHERQESSQEFSLGIESSALIPLSRSKKSSAEDESRGEKACLESRQE
jgi:hypothetical protein